MKNRLKLLSFYTIVVVLLVICIELLCLGLYLSIKDGDDLSRLPRINTSGIKNFSWGDLKPHPYFGYTFSHEDRIAGVKLARIQKKENKPLIIGIFGGSVAQSFVESKGSQFLLAGLKEKVPELKDKDLQIVNFAVGAHKQPQAFHMMMFYLEYVDYIINIEGWNEILPRSFHEVDDKFDMNVNDGLPAFSEFLFDYNQKTLIELGKVTFINDLKSKVSDLRSGPILSFSSSFKLVEEVLRKISLKLHPEVTLKTVAFNISKEKTEYSRSEAGKRVERWYKYALSQHLISNPLGKTSVTFIQPNHHNKGSKKIDKDENYVEHLANYATGAYRELEEKVALLQEKQFHVYSLSHIFKNIEGKIYIDTEHMNSRGNQIMAEEILRILVKNKVFK